MAAGGDFIVPAPSAHERLDFWHRHGIVLDEATGIKGGQGAVRFGWKEATPVAVKTCFEAGPALREAALLATIPPHENVMHFMGAPVRLAGGRALVVMRRLGGDLLGPKSPARARALVRGLPRALAHVHAAGVAHRDIKLENILVEMAPDGTPLGVVLADFGLARPADCLWTAGRAGGHTWLAPEEVSYIDDHRTVRPFCLLKADVHAAGRVLLYELTGAYRPAFERRVVVPGVAAPAPAAPAAAADDEAVAVGHAHPAGAAATGAAAVEEGAVGGGGRAVVPSLAHLVDRDWFEERAAVHALRELSDELEALYPAVLAGDAAAWDRAVAATATLRRLVVIRWMVHPDPSERPSAAEVLAEFEAIEDAEAAGDLPWPLAFA